MQTTKELPETQDGFLRADLAAKGDTITLPATGSATITYVQKAVSFDHKRIIIIETQDGQSHTYSPRAYIPVTPAA